MEITLGDGTDSSQWQCELHDMDSWKSGRRFVAVLGLNATDIAQLRSGDSTMFAEGAVIVNGTLRVPKGKRKQFARTGRKGPAEQQEYAAMEDLSYDQLRRGLTPVVEQRSVLVVRVNAKDVSLSNSSSAISNAFFGTATGTNSLKERYETCSYGEVTIVPGTGQDVSNGITTVTVGVNAARNDNSVLRDAALTILTGKFGDLASKFDHVALCLPKGTLNNGQSWIGYGKRWKT
jgi:hypothetical protein